VLGDQLEQRLQVGAGLGLVERGPAALGVGEDDRERELVILGVEVEEQVLDHVHDLVDARVRAVDLVDVEDHGQPRLERLAQHEARLRERALGCVDEQQHAVDHRQGALDLAAEIGVAGGVDDVDLDAVPVDGGVLREDRDPALALEVHRVHHARLDLGALAERAALVEHRVDERRLPVVDVGDDRDIAQVVARDQRRHREETRAAARIGLGRGAPR
jgi:hypothetical protein